MNNNSHNDDDDDISSNSNDNVDTVSVVPPTMPVDAGQRYNDDSDDDDSDDDTNNNGDINHPNVLNYETAITPTTATVQQGTATVPIANSTDDDDDDNMNVDAEQQQQPTVVAHIRGTNIHVPTTAKIFLHFLRTFRSLHHSSITLKQRNRIQKQQQQQQQRTLLSSRNRNINSDDEDEDDEDKNSDDSESDDDDAETTVTELPLYLCKLCNMIHDSIGLPHIRTTISDDSMDIEDRNIEMNATTSTTAIQSPTINTKSFEIDMIHLYYHFSESLLRNNNHSNNNTCQQLYYQIVQHPMELIPLMDILLQQEYERLLQFIMVSVRRNSRNRNNNNDSDDDDDDDESDGNTDEEYQNLFQEGYENIVSMNMNLYRNIPNLMDMDTNEIILPQIQVRPYNLKIVSNIRQLDPISMDTLICCKGMIVRCSSIIPDLKVAHFACTICNHSVTVTIDRGRIHEPTQRCIVCQTSNTYQLQHNRCIFADKQLIRLQETPDEVPAGQTPASVITFCYDDIVDSIVPGDKVEITGILRAQPIRVHPKISKIKSIYKTYIDVIHFYKISGMQQQSKDKVPDPIRNNNSSNQQSNTSQKHSQWSEQRIQQLQELSQDPNIYDKLVQSLAPSIWELDNCKKGILCMLFGGNTVRVPRGTNSSNNNNNVNRTTHNTTSATSWLDDDDTDGQNTNNGGNQNSNMNENTSQTKLNKRGDINILLCGDPGTSKSQLLSYVNKLCTRGIYTSGKGSSAVGLTASVVRDPETRDFALESGALVLSDLGICCIDEFDKMSDSTRSVLHEAMEQQTVSIAKAGIIATLRARTSVLASANPTESRYNPNRSVVDNIQLPPTLLSRFDLIYLILDAPNVEHDRRLAQHLVGLYYETPNVVEPPLDQALLRDYIEYARQNIHPEISDEAASYLIDSYLEMRNPSSGSGGGAVLNNGTRTISATARQLESLIRISEALAKMRYSTIVTRNDAKEAIRLMKVATQAAATDPRTGKIDMDMITTGRSSNTREMEEQLDISLQELFRERRGTQMKIRDVTRQLMEINNVTLPQDDILDGLRRMHADGHIQFNERTQTIFIRSTI